MGVATVAKLLEAIAVSEDALGHPGITEAGNATEGSRDAEELIANSHHGAICG